MQPENNEAAVRPMLSASCGHGFTHFLFTFGRHVHGQDLTGTHPQARRSGTGARIGALYVILLVGAFYLDEHVNLGCQRRC